MFQQDYKPIASNVFHETPEGYLTGRLCVTGAGVFRYLNDDRKFVGRLRSVDQVKDATDSLNNKPVTLQHPCTPVTPENVKSLSVGMSSNDASFDGLNDFITITVTDKAAVEAIKRGEVKAVSCGYKCNVVDNAGVWQGCKHEQEQKDIVYNHIALVREGRAGDQVRFCVGDSAEAEDIFDSVAEDKEFNNDGSKADTPEVIVNDTKNQNTKEQSMKTIQLDGVDYQADEKVIEALQAAQDDASTKLEEIHTLLDANAELEGKVADLQEQLDTANDEVDEALIDEAVNAKLAILDVARNAGIECDTSDDVSEIKRQVILAAFDGIELETITDEASVNALFCSASKVLSDAADAADEADQAQHKNPAAQYDGAGRRDEDTCDSLEDQLFKETINLSNGKKKEN